MSELENQCPYLKKKLDNEAMDNINDLNITECPYKDGKTTEDVDSDDEVVNQGGSCPFVDNSNLK